MRYINLKPTTSKVSIPSVITLRSESTAKAVGRNPINGGCVTTPPRNWRGKIINHAIPPAELEFLTNDARNNPNPRDEKVTKNGMKNSRNRLALGLISAPNKMINSKKIIIWITPTINCANNPDKRILLLEAGVVIKR